MNDRTRGIWVPGLVSLTVAMTFLMILQLSGVQPQFIWMRSGPPLELYTPWVIAHPVFGAIGAYLSRRAGGDRRACLAAGLFPSMVMFGVFCVGLAILVVNRQLHPVSLLVAFGQISCWIVLPGLALLAGALPFLKASKLHAS